MRLGGPGSRPNPHLKFVEVPGIKLVTAWSVVRHANQYTNGAVNNNQYNYKNNNNNNNNKKKKKKNKKIFEAIMVKLKYKDVERHRGMMVNEHTMVGSNMKK